MNKQGVHSATANGNQAFADILFWPPFFVMHIPQIINLPTLFIALAIHKRKQSKKAK